MGPDSSKVVADLISTSSVSWAKGKMAQVMAASGQLFFGRW